MIKVYDKGKPKMANIIPMTLVALTGFLRRSRDTLMTTIRFVTLATAYVNGTTN